MVEAKAGQWWTDRGSVAERYRLRICGLTWDGKRVIVERNEGTVSTLDLDYFLNFKEHLPECTSFEWVPEVYPQYRVSFQPEEFAFVRLNDKHTFTYVRLDGKEDPPCRYGYAWETISERTKLTEAEALARIVKPEPALRKITLATYVYGDTLPLKYVGFCITPDEVPEILRSWKYGRILKTEEFEVPCE